MHSLVCGQIRNLIELEIPWNCMEMNWIEWNEVRLTTAFNFHWIELNWLDLIWNSHVVKNEATQYLKHVISRLIVVLQIVFCGILQCSKWLFQHSFLPAKIHVSRFSFIFSHFLATWRVTPEEYWNCRATFQGSRGAIWEGRGADLEGRGSRGWAEDFWRGADLEGRNCRKIAPIEWGLFDANRPTE